MGAGEGMGGSAVQKALISNINKELLLGRSWSLSRSGEDARRLDGSTPPSRFLRTSCSYAFPPGFESFPIRPLPDEIYALSFLHT